MKEILTSSNVKNQMHINKEVIYIKDKEIWNIDNGIKISINCERCTVFNGMIIALEVDERKMTIIDHSLKIRNIYESSQDIGYYSVRNFISIDYENELFTITNDFQLEAVVLPFMELYSYQDLIIQREKRSRLHSLTKKGVKNWSYELPYNEVLEPKDLLFANNKCIIPTTNSNLIILNLDDGTELHKLVDVPTSYLVSSNKDKIISFASNVFGDNHLTVIDLNLGKVIHDTTFDDLFYSIRTSRSLVYKDKLYFICEYYRPNPKKDDVRSYPHLGRLDLTSYEIDWIKKVGDWKKEGQMFEAPIVIENRVYLRSIDGRAYIYEMEN